MRLFKSSEYAIRCLVYIAGLEDKMCSVKDLSDALNIPYKFLGRLMARLRDAGLVASIRGKNGGYALNPDWGTIRLERIVDVVEGLEAFDRCLLGFPLCDSENPCPMHDHWQGPRAQVREMMAEVTLEELAKSPGRRLV